jgi:DNA recombination protein RmuC
MINIAVLVVALIAVAVAVFSGRELFKARIRLAESEARLRNQEELNLAKSAELAAQRESLKAEFSKLAADLLGERQSALNKSNESSVKALFSDLKMKLDKYEKEVGESAKSNASLGVEMRTRIDGLQRFADEARAFTAALTGGNKIQGNKGEEILSSLFERSGFEKGTHYDVQVGERDEGRPDACVYDIRNHCEILIDSKMNIKDYISACGLPEDAAHKADRERYLKAHAASVRRQIDGLAAKDYAKTLTPKDGYSILPLVAMFCPFNAVLESALAVDPAIVQYAYERGIVLVTPLTLWGYLWLVSWGWKQHAVERRYDEIQSLGRDVVSAIDSLLNDLESVGECLEKAKKSYDGLYRRATEDKGQMSVKRAATTLLEYGVTPKGRLKRLDARSPTCNLQ